MCLFNRLELLALQVAEFYRRRWQIKLFFKRIKQNLKIKAFYGTSNKPVLIRILTDLIAYLLMAWLKLKSTVGCWGLPELSPLAQIMLLESGDLHAMLCPHPFDIIPHPVFWTQGFLCRPEE